MNARKLDFHRNYKNESQIESSFPTREINEIAQAESWRKEIYRPIYHIHKWWAIRLGSVFRAISLGALIKGNKPSIWECFYNEHSFKDKVVFDPFMGSGTTLGECLKLGARAIGNDINPVSTFAVSQALSNVDLNELENTFNLVYSDTLNETRTYYLTKDARTNELVHVMYFFWVKEVTTPSNEKILLFDNYVFAKNAYPRKKPISQILCKFCGEINQDRYDCEALTCKKCRRSFNPQVGTVKGTFVYGKDNQKYRIKDLIQATDCPPNHKMYAILAMDANGNKFYKSIDKYDVDLYIKAKKNLSKLNLPLPIMEVRQGHNTKQAIGYNYRLWKDLFNDRQLLSLGLLLQRILKIEDKAIRQQLLCLFSGTLEFNNMFCSFKGEGTGAVRHMFSHHILKPEKKPLENNVLGTKRSSGTFASLFYSRLLPAKKYLSHPFDLKQVRDDKGNRDSKAKFEKVVVSKPLIGKIVDSWDKFERIDNSVLVMNGNSGNLTIPNESVDAVITDPPYFDFIHYSELSDFFYAWLSVALGNECKIFRNENSSNIAEVQEIDEDKFSLKLASVFKECYRVLKNDGLLIFSFHHSQVKGWTSIYNSIHSSGFKIVKVHPVKAEMAGTVPKNGTKIPIHFDAIIVCKKTDSEGVEQGPIDYQSLKRKVESTVNELSIPGLSISSADKFVFAAGIVLEECSKLRYKSSNVIPPMDYVYNDYLNNA